MMMRAKAKLWLVALMAALWAVLGPDAAGAVVTQYFGVVTVVTGGVATARSNAVVIGANTIYLGTTNLLALGSLSVTNFRFYGTGRDGGGTNEFAIRKNYGNYSFGSLGIVAKDAPATSSFDPGALYFFDKNSNAIFKIFQDSGDHEYAAGMGFFTPTGLRNVFNWSAIWTNTGGGTNSWVDGVRYNAIVCGGCGNADAGTRFTVSGGPDVAALGIYSWTNQPEVRVRAFDLSGADVPGNFRVVDSNRYWQFGVSHPNFFIAVMNPVVQTDPPITNLLINTRNGTVVAPRGFILGTNNFVYGTWDFPDLDRGFQYIAPTNAAILVVRAMASGKYAMTEYRTPGATWFVGADTSGGLFAAPDALMFRNQADGKTFGYFSKTTGDLVFGAGNGTPFTNSVVLTSPNGHRWRITVNDSGVLSTQDLGTTPP